MTYSEAVVSLRYQKKVKTRGFHGRIIGQRDNRIFDVQTEVNVISVPHRKISLARR